MILLHVQAQSVVFTTPVGHDFRLDAWVYKTHLSGSNVVIKAANGPLSAFLMVTVGCADEFGGVTFTAWRRQ